MAEVLIVGGGRIGSYLLSLLHDGGHDVCLVETDAACVERLVSTHAADLIVQGSGTDPEILEAAGAHRTNTVVAVTDRDETNLVVTGLAKFEFGVPRTIGRVINPRNAWLYTAEMGVDVALNQADIIGHLVAEEMSLGEMMTLLKLRRGQFSLVEERVHPASVAVSRNVAQLDIDGRCVLVGVFRGPDLLMPRDDVALLADDEVFALVDSEAAAALSALLGPPEGDVAAV
jgi:trk system potassium uptake protein TrkA